MRKGRFTWVVFVVFAVGLLFLEFRCLEREDRTRRVALVFTGGPEPEVLEKLLPLLAKRHIRATFFVTGETAEQEETWVMREDDEGHEVESHGWEHIDIAKWYRENPDTAVEGIQKTADVIREATRRPPRFFLPPFWKSSPALDNLLMEKYHLTVLDANSPYVAAASYTDPGFTPLAAFQRAWELVRERERKGRYFHVLVFPERECIVDALPTLLDSLDGRGYQYDRMDETGLERWHP